VIELFHRGLELQKIGLVDEAQVIYEQILNSNPLHYEALEYACTHLAQQKDWNKIRFLLDNAIRLNNLNPYLYNNLGIVLHELKEFEVSIKVYKQALRLNPNFAEAFSNLGNVLKEQGEFEKALVSYEQAIKLNPNYSIAYSNRSIVLKEIKLLEKALESANTAIKLNGEYLEEAYNNRGIILYELKSFDKALESYNHAINLKSDYAEVYNNRGNVLKELQLFNEAIESFKKAIELRNDYSEAYANLGIIFKELKFFDEALINFNKAIELNSNIKYLHGLCLHTQMQMCNWQNFQEKIDSLVSCVSADKKYSDSFPILAVIDSPLIHKKAAEISINDKYPLNLIIESRFIKQPKNKITLGYYSSDFKEHPVSYLTAELFELHDRNKFELIAFYSGIPESSSMHKRVSSAFSKFINIRHLNDKSVAELSREIGVDIAIDLTGMTQNNRVGVFSYRAAPVQLSYIGYLGTMGAKYYDYLIADKTIIPADSQKYFTEKIVYLPSYQVNDSKRIISNKVFTRAELNLSENVFVFCCFNNNFKITPSTFDGWMRILTAVPSSVLYLYAETNGVQIKLKSEASKRGINELRLIFGTHIDRAEYLARYKIADLFLDTFPYNAGTTASDALWAGLPVLTYMGESFASRVAASLLNAIEMPELITTSQKEYEATAIELASKPEKLKAIKEKLKQNRLTTALFDTPRFTKNIETAYEEMYKRYYSKMPLDHIYV